MAVASSIIAAGIIAGASAGTSIYAAKKQGEANQQAIDARTQADTQALDFQKGELQYEKELAAQKLAYEHQLDQIAQARQAQLYSDLGPYRSLSTGALGSLAGMTGHPVPTTAPPSVPAVPTSPVSLGGLPTVPSVIAPGVDRVQAPNGYTVSGLTSAPLPGGGGPSSYVRMQAPDGEVRPIPSSDVQAWEAKGAKVVQ